MTTYVIDSSAITAFLRQEPHRPELEGWLGNGVLTYVNLVETVTILTELGLATGALHHVFSGLGLKTVPITQDIALLAGRMDRKLVRGGLSLGDRCCLAYAKANGLPAVTGDRAWSEVAEPLGIEIIQIRD